jgi:AcrR family transcriptional regulator
MSQQTDTVTPADGRDTRWADHRQARRERLIETAIAMIDRDGVSVSVPSIASEAGIPRSVVYKLFKDREDLDDQIRARIIESVTAKLLPLLVIRGASAREMVHAGISTYVGWVAAHPNLHRFLGAGSAAKPSHGSKLIASGKEAFAHRLQGFIEQFGPEVVGTRLPKGTAQNAAFALVGMTDASVNRWIVSGSRRSSKKDLIEFLTDSVCSVLETVARTSGGTFDADRPLSL